MNNPSKYIQSKASLKKKFLENEQSSFPSESYNNSFESSIKAKPSYSNTTSESAARIIEDISEYKELRHFYPLSKKDVDTLNFRAVREFSSNFVNQLLLKLYIKYPEKIFKNKFTFLSYMEKILANEKHQGPLVNHTSFRFSCNISTIEKNLLEYEKYLSQIENSSDTSKEMQVRKKIAGRFSTNVAYEILTQVEFKTNHGNSVVAALVPNRLDLSERQIATLGEQLEAVYGINGYYVTVLGEDVNAANVGYAEDSRWKGERKEELEKQYSKIKEPDIEYIIRLSEWLIDHIVSRNFYRCLRKQGLQLRTITNLNHRYEALIPLIKEIVGFKRLDSIREVHSVPLEYASMIVLDEKELRGILKRDCSELRYSNNASVSISQLRQYHKQGTELIFTSVDINYTNMKNSVRPRAYSVLGKISNIRISQDVSYIDIIKFIKISDIIYYCGAYYGMPKQHEDYKELDESEFKELKELVEQIGKLFIQQEGFGLAMPIYVEGTEGYEKYAEDFSYCVLSWQEQYISNDFEQKSTKEKLEYVLSLLIPKTLSIQEEEKSLDARLAGIEEYLKDGLDLYSGERYEEAIVAFDKAIALDLKCVIAYRTKGYALLRLMRYKETLEVFNKVIALLPDEEAYSDKGLALCYLKRYEEAIVAYDKAIALNSKHRNVIVLTNTYLEVYKRKGDVLNNLKRYEEAIVACDKAIELKPDYVEAYTIKGNALDGLERDEEAIAAYDKAIALDPKYENAIVDKKVVLDAIAHQASDKDFEVLLANTPLPSNVRKVAEQKIARLKGSQGSNDGDRSYTEKYLNYLFRLPWGKFDKASIDIIEAEKVLDENHYGLSSVKQKIIESLAFIATSKDTKPPILCLVGAPGVGKTSIAKIISKALNRKSVTLSLAGARDEGLIRGCMDFYMGARPSKVLSLLSEVGSSNPIMILDEIDKISQERGALLEGALLQLIDPSQNDSFTDDYFDFGYDMSKVFFIATANSIDNISYPLLHRMEVIDISGYTDNEKVKIVQDYIIPKLIKEANVPSNKFTLSDELIRYIIENYTRESGVRDVERKIRELLQKSLLAEARKEQITLTKETIDEYFKHSKYHKQKLQDDEVTIGMIHGLAHTARGGDLIKIEASKYKGDGKIKATGKLGEVLKESIDATMTCLKSSIDSKTKEISDNILKTHDIHIHLPAGATPKDGPSAGITIYTALYSLLSNKKIRQDIAMTGEITLKGRVLEIGGLKEKLTAAVREGIKEVIIPKDNERDLAGIPEEIKEALVIHTVSNTSEILGIVFKTQISNKNTKQRTQKENMGKVLQFPKHKKDKKN